MIRTILTTGLLALIAGLATTSSPVQGSTRASPAIEVQLLAVNAQATPLYYQHGDYWCTNLKTPAILIRNASDAAVRLDGLTVAGLVDGCEVTSCTFYAEELDRCIAHSGHALNTWLADPDDQASLDGLTRRYGVPVVMEAGYAECAEIPAGGYAAAMLSRLAFFLYEGSAKIEALTITVQTAGQPELPAVLQVPLNDYTCRGEYHFPVKGPAMVASVPAGHSHRFANAQEFALDIFDIRRFPAGNLSSSAVPNETVIIGSDQAADYYIYGREILAIGDGIVVDTADGFPDELAANPQDYFAPRIERLTPELLSLGVTMANITAGNYILIDHENGEYSRYCHLNADIRVASGDRVTRGQVIATAGNSGNSTEPHLHLELLDSADFMTANGLPIVFANLPLGSALDSPFFGEKNSLIFSEFIFLYTQ